MIDPTAPWSSQLPDFLAARYDEDVLYANNVHRDECAAVEYFEPIDAPCNCGYPARFLAELAAKRRHIAMWMEARKYLRAALERLHAAQEDGAIKRASHDYSEGLGMQSVTEDLLRLDAAVYSTHDDFDDAWRTDD